MRLHLLRHSGAGEGDALDVLGQQVDQLGRLLGEWATTRPGGSGSGPPTAVVRKWDHGTVGKLLLERAALFLAAEEAVADVVERAGSSGRAAELRHHADVLRDVVDQMDRSSRGVQPMSLALSADFDDAARRLSAAMASASASASTSGGPGSEMVARLDQLLGARRAELPTAAFVRSHAPTHPGRWHRPFLVRLHTAYDRLRGIPWAESPLADRAITRRYDQEGKGS